MKSVTKNGWEVSNELVAIQDVEHTEELKWWILGFGAKVAVLAPTSLREEIWADLDAAVLRYL
jgi:predicted DNA-binding transcriptional regulator YafY